MIGLPPAPIPPAGLEGVSPTGESDAKLTDEAVAARAAVKRWQERVKLAKRKWEPDFKRMRQMEEFASGIQWPDQQSLNSESYVCNWTIQLVNQKVSQLYARNPKAECTPRKRMLYQLWDEKMETLQQAVMNNSMAVQTGMFDPYSEAIIRDYEQGLVIEEHIQGVCRTLEINYQYQIDTCRPEFKEQMKQAVRRAVICGVAYGRPVFKREAKPELSSVDVRQTVVDRARRAKLIVDQIDEGKIEMTDAQVDTLHSLFASMGVSVTQGDEYGLPERLEYDFPPATSVIPDDRCRSLKEFIGARFVAQEYLLPIDEVNAFFETKIEATGDVVKYNEQGEVTSQTLGEARENAKVPIVCLWEIFDYTTKTHCFVCEGHKEYVLPPEPIDPCVSGFYPLFALTFNDIEASGTAKTSIYPPSDAFLVEHVQREWNRSREGLRKHRKANMPTYVTANGHLTKEDKEGLADAEPNQVIELQGVPLGTDPDKVIRGLPKVPIEPLCYETESLSQDMQLAGRAQEANLGPAQPNVTATVGTIAEQSRMTQTSSNVDDLDCFLTRMAKAGMEMMLREMSTETVQRIVGIGAKWPMQDKEEYINAIDMCIQAASSGRPNKAMEIANIERLAPLLLQFGANPQFVIREIIKRLDDTLDPKEAFPVPGMASPMGAASPIPSGPQAQGVSGLGSGPAASPVQPLVGLQSGSPVPLAGHNPR
jgi:hypothetical protein